MHFLRSSLLALTLLSSALSPALLSGAEPTPADLRFAHIFKPFKTNNASLSPDGKYLAYTLREEGILHVVVLEIDKPAKAVAKIAVASDETSTPTLTTDVEKTPAQIRWMKWVTPSRLVIETNQNFPSANKAGDWTNTPGLILAFDADGTNSKQLVTPKDISLTQISNADNTPKNVILTPDKPSTENSSAADPLTSVLNSLGDDQSSESEESNLPEISSTPRSPQVFDLDPASPNSIIVKTAGAHRYVTYHVDITTGKMKDDVDEKVEDNLAPLIDRQGKARACIPSTLQHGFPHKYAIDRGGLLRWTNFEKFVSPELAASFSVSPDTFAGVRSIPIGFAENPQQIYYASNVGRDTYGIYCLDIKTGQRIGSAIESPSFDLIEPVTDAFPSVNPLVFDRFDRQLIGVRHESNRKTTTWLRPAWQETQLLLEGTFPGHNVELLEWSQSGNRFLVLVRGPADAGAYYVFDRDTKKLSEFVRRSGWLDAGRSHQTQDFSIPAPAGHIITGNITLPRAVRTTPIPVLVLCPSEPWQRTHSEFRTDVQSYADMGFIVLQINARGTWGFGIKHRQAITGGLEEAQSEDIITTIDALAKKLPIALKRVALIGEKRGAFIALRSAQLHPDRFKCVVAIEPTIDIAAWLAETRWNSGESGPAITRAFLGSDARIKANPLLNNTESLTRPVLVLSYPGADGEPRTFNHLTAATFVRKLQKQDTPVEFVELSEDYMRRLPNASSIAFHNIEGFLNEFIYGYKVKAGEAKEVAPTK